METVTKVKVFTKAIAETDVLYVAQQLHRDLRQIRKSYSKLLSHEEVEDIYDSVVTFLIKEAITNIGFCIYDPKDDNLVYHEWIYIVLQGDAIPEGLRDTQQGKGGEPFRSAQNLPSSAEFTAWVVWSEKFLDLPQDQQEEIVNETIWNMPGKSLFKRKHKHPTGWRNEGFYVSGQLGVQMQIYEDFE